MNKFKDIKQFCKENNIPIEWEENNKLWIKACDVGDNFYDYGEEEPELIIDEEYAILADDPRINFTRCCDCCGCAGW